MIVTRVSVWRNWKYKLVFVVSALFLIFFYQMQSSVTTFNHRILLDDEKNDLHHYDLGQLNHTNAERLRLARSTCSSFKKSESSMSRMRIHFNTRTAYCAVPKTSSTFWASLFSYLNHNNGNGPGRVTFHPMSTLRDVVHKEEFAIVEEEELKDYFRFMFVRDPYSRLWSTYLDKFFLIDFWHTKGDLIDIFFKSTFGQEVLKRTGQTYDSKPGCNSALTFAQFVTYVAFSGAQQPKDLNEHWRSVEHLCDPCDFHPHLIGHVETFVQDQKPVLERMNMTWVTENYNHAEYQMKVVLYDNFFIFEQRSSLYGGCTDLLDIARRLWAAFQKYGYISHNLRLPESKLGQNFTADQFYDVVLCVYRSVPEPQRSQISKQQRKAAMEDDYRTVPSLVLEMLPSLYLYDFVTFGYEIRPPELFANRYTK